MENSSDQFDKVPDHLKCPVSMDLPKGKVLQCRLGHILCEKCYFKLKDCPQCRLPFGKEPIRNLAVETSLDEFNFECPHKSAGCEEKLDRKTFEDHVQECHFNFAKFGPLVNACKHIGICSNCSFQMNSGNVVEAIRHFRTVHDFDIYDYSTNIGFEMENFVTRVMSRHRPYPTIRIIANQKKKGYGFLVLLKADEQFRGQINWNAFYWRYPNPNDTTHDVDDLPMPYTVELNLFGAGKNSVKWSFSPINIFNSGNPAFRTPSMKMSGLCFADKKTDTVKGGIKILSTSE